MSLPVPSRAAWLRLAILAPSFGVLALVSVLYLRPTPRPEPAAPAGTPIQVDRRCLEEAAREAGLYKDLRVGDLDLGAGPAEASPFQSPSTNR
jgi:hypothetical protein